jgi:Domain of unknown function (DUF4177)
MELHAQCYMSRRYGEPVPCCRRLLRAAARRSLTLLEYKILTQRDKTFSGAFDADALERMLNEHAADGWRLTEGFTAASLWKTMRTEIILILERPRPETG